LVLSVSSVLKYVLKPDTGFKPPRRWTSGPCENRSKWKGMACDHASWTTGTKRRTEKATDGKFYKCEY